CFGDPTLQRVHAAVCRSDRTRLSTARREVQLSNPTKALRRIRRSRLEPLHWPWALAWQPVPRPTLQRCNSHSSWRRGKTVLQSYSQESPRELFLIGLRCGLPRIGLQGERQTSQLVSLPWSAFNIGVLKVSTIMTITRKNAFP